MSILERLKGHPHVKAGTAYTILFAVGFCHLLNDMIQSVIPAMYPVLKDNLGLTFAQIGIITLVFQMTSSIFQPFIGNYADRHPQPYSLAAGMCFTLTGLLALAFSSNFPMILLSVAMIGFGRVAERHGAASEKTDIFCDGDTCSHDFLEVFLQCLHDKLFHIFPHREIRSLGPGVPVLSFRLPCCLRSRHPARRSGRNLFRTDVRTRRHRFRAFRLDSRPYGGGIYLPPQCMAASARDHCRLPAGCQGRRKGHKGVIRLPSARIFGDNQ